MSKIQFCPRCGEKTVESVCPICFTRLTEPSVRPQMRDLTEAEKASLPPFTCPKCGKRELMTNGTEYYCKDCGVKLLTPQRMVDPVSENPDYIENPKAEKRFDPMTGKPLNDGQTVDFTAPTEVKQKRGLTRGGLTAILVGIVALFTAGGVVAACVNGVEKQENRWQQIFEDSFESDFFSDIPGFEEFDPFEENQTPQQDTPDVSQDESVFDWQTGAEIAQEDYYPNGCNEEEYLSLKKGMTYGQISAIIGGDAGNWYETVDQGEKCLVFQWVTEDSRGVVSVKMVEEQAVEFHVESY